MIMILFMLILTLLLLYLSIVSMRRYVTIKQRVEKISSSYATVERDIKSHKHEFIRKYIIIARDILDHLHILTGETITTLNKRLANAGWLSKNALIVFLSIQMIAIFGSIFLGFLLILFVPPIASKPFVVRCILVILLMWLGYRLPEFYLSRSIKSYSIKLRRSILEFLDLFLICIEAGFGNDKALSRISNELALLHPELSEQVRILITELNLFSDRSKAWDNFAERTGLEEVRVIVQIIQQSERLGTSIAQALRAQVEMFRTERLNYVEHKAMRLPTLLTLPLVFFIFPTLLMVILGPAILKAIEILGSG